MIAAAAANPRRWPGWVRATAVAVLATLISNAGQYAWNEAETTTATAVNRWWQGYVASYCEAHPPTAPQLRK